MLVKLLVVWASNTLAIFVADWLIAGIRLEDGWKVIIAGAVFGLINLIVKPIVTVLALPAIILTVGIALFFVNLLMLYLTAWLVPGFDIDTFWAAVGGTIVIWLVNVVVQGVFGVNDRGKRRARARR